MTRPDPLPVDPVPTRRRRVVLSPFFAPSFFASLSLLMFGDVLISTSRVVSFHDTDLALQFIPWREFGFSQLSAGNLPLWNPHIYGGTPYFAGFQSALLYPPNWLHLILPVGLAINWIVALHVMLAGYFTYLWSRGRQISIEGSIIAGVIFMFSGPYFLHIYAGHLPHLAVMVWTPLMLLSLDQLAATGRWRWIWLGMVAAAMHILGGHPQYVYYTGIGLTLYLLLQLAVARHRAALVGGFVAMYAGAVLLTAIQLLPGIDAAGEFVRSGGTKYEFASTFALPPQNLVTLVAPTFFGNVPLSDGAANPYWGPGYLWEMSLYAGVTGLLLAAIGLVRASRRISIVAGAMVLVCIILSLGRHTPLYRPMFDWLPGYSSFRGQVKFAYLAVLFMAMLAGVGFDTLGGRKPSPWAAACLGAVLVAVGALIAIIKLGGGVWGSWVASMIESAKAAGEWYVKRDLTDAKSLDQLAAGAVDSLWVAIALVVLAGAAIVLYSRHKLVPYLLVGLACIEMFTFARLTRATMDVNQARTAPPMWREALARTPQRMRVLTVSPDYANLGMSMGFDNINGYDPGVLKRYAELIYASQNLKPSDASQYVPFQRVSPSIFRLLRCGLVCFNPKELPGALASPLPEAYLVSDWVKLSSRDTILGYLSQNSFDAATTVVLENDPGIATVPSASAPGRVTAARMSTDSFDIDATLDRPAILVVGTNYSTGWRVRPIQTVQGLIRIMPANWAQIGIPLEKGRHHFVLEYSPASFRVGRWISAAAVLALCVGLVLLMRSTLKGR